ncbi:MAG: DNA repair protein RecO [Acidobacteria bacterium]|nr:DNA repair protein RecO [Acidobacteriota bacterium]MYF15482.1 DNA repair protein RecO [Acidobacteriota bacterium]MYI95881.1 DNA repair protein RecO [Acidobacteriota bacterium]
MPLKQSRAFVLRTYAVAEADRVCVLFSGDEGKVRAWARGARKPRSRYGGALDIGNEVEAGWYEREGRELVHLDRCELVTSALPLARDPVRAAALGYLSRLVDTFAPDREADPRLFRLISACRDALLDDLSAELVVAYFEAWLLRLSGLYPRPGRCACGAGFEQDGAVFFAAGPVYACTRCAPGHGEPTDRLSAGALGLLDTFWAEPPSAAAPNAATVRELFRFHGRLTAGHADRALPARHALEGLLQPVVHPVGAPAR